MFIGIYKGCEFLGFLDGKVKGHDKFNPNLLFRGG